MKRRTVILVLAAASVALSPALAAGGEKGDLEIGLFSGYGFPDEYGQGVASWNPDDDALHGVRIGAFVSPRWSLEFSGQRFSSTSQFAPSSGATNVEFDIASLRLNLLHNFRVGRKFRPFFTFGAGRETTDLGTTFDENDVGYNAGAGLRWFLSDTFGLRLDGRYVSTDVGGTLNARQDNLEGSFGILWAFGGRPPTDTDGDGIFDRRDRCPDTPRGAVVDDAGCPEDSDNDGVPDGLDRCPLTAVGVPVDEAGCPRDTDGDGVHDGLDACSATPRGARVDSRGCPTDADADGVADGLDACPDTPRGAVVDGRGCPTDQDGDGVVDGLDQCSRTPAGARVDATGCPLDTDGDGVFDGLDKCPGTPGGTQVDSKGCQVLFEEQRRTLVLEGVNFEFDSARLTPEAEAILDRVAMSLAEWKEIRVEVAGHTDSQGNDRYNLELSSRRAAAVREYLIGKGIDETRMTARGYGESRPIVANERTKEDRRKNRRVELKKLN